MAALTSRLPIRMVWLSIPSWAWLVVRSFTILVVLPFCKPGSACTPLRVVMPVLMNAGKLLALASPLAVVAAFVLLWRQRSEVPMALRLLFGVLVLLDAGISIVFFGEVRMGGGLEGLFGPW